MRIGYNHYFATMVRGPLPPHPLAQAGFSFVEVAGVLDCLVGGSDYFARAITMLQEAGIVMYSLTKDAKKRGQASLPDRVTLRFMGKHSAERLESLLRDILSSHECNIIGVAGVGVERCYGPIRSLERPFS